jgi:hypothetical protein
MNQRIRELAEQARDWGYAEHSGYTAQLLFEQKFAELIVRECADICDDNNNFLQAKILKKHFGVEEQEKVAHNPKCSVCGTTENVRYMGGHQPYLCDSVDCIPF